MNLVARSHALGSSLSEQMGIFYVTAIGAQRRVLFRRSSSRIWLWQDQFTMEARRILETAIFFSFLCSAVTLITHPVFHPKNQRTRVLLLTLHAKIYLGAGSSSPFHGSFPDILGDAQYTSHLTLVLRNSWTFLKASSPTRAGLISGRRSFARNLVYINQSDTLALILQSFNLSFYV